MLAWPRLCPVPPPLPTRVHPPPSNVALPSSENPPQPPRKGGGRAEAQAAPTPSQLPPPVTTGHEARGMDRQVGGIALPPVSWLDRSCFSSFGKAPWGHVPLAHKPCGSPGPLGLDLRLLQARLPPLLSPRPSEHTLSTPPGGRALLPSQPPLLAQTSAAERCVCPVVSRSLRPHGL